MRPPAPERVEIARPSTQPVPVVDLTPEPEVARQPALIGAGPVASAPLSYQPAPGASVFAEPMPAAAPAPAVVSGPDYPEYHQPEPVAAEPEYPEYHEPEPVAHEPEYHQPLAPVPPGPAIAHPVGPAPVEAVPAPVAAPVLAAEPEVEAEADEDLERLFWTESEALADLQGGGRSGRLLSRITGTHRKVG